MSTPKPPRPRGASRLVLGAAQLGMAYGISNTTALAPHEKQTLLAAAVAGGIDLIDTARAYGTSEDVIGQFLASDLASACRVVTKLAPLTELSASASGDEVSQAVEESLRQSRQSLGITKFDTVLLHRASHLTAWNGAVWHMLQDHASRGSIGTIGVSVQTPDELVLALDTPGVAHIQLPFNILDWRWDGVLPRLIAARKQRRVTVHARSLLLQGLLVASRPESWAMAGVANPQPIQEWLKNQVEQFGRDSVADLCMAYVIAQDWVDGLVVGIDNIAQLQANLQFVTSPPLAALDLDQILQTRPRLTIHTLDPAKWSRRA